METQNKQTRLIRISQELYDYIDESAERSTDSFDKILKRLLKQ
jgi:negative regulator of replication initiation